jgi:1,4-dihydroxy-2-naphthoyl-CoA hydrolase
MPIWISPLTPAEMAAVSRRTAAESIGVTFTGVGENWLEGTVPLDERTASDQGSLHHGALAVLAETLASVGATMCVDASRQACLGQVLHLQHAHPIARGPVSGRARPLWVEPQGQLWEIELRDGSGVLVCMAQLTLAVVDRPSTAPAERARGAAG